MIGWILGILGGALLVLAILAPLESLGWWWRRGERSTIRLVTAHDAPAADRPLPKRFIVYLSGVGVLDGHGDTPEEERACLAEISRRAGVPVLDGIFPYAVHRRGLLQGTMAGFWRAIAKIRSERRASMLPFVIQLRNVLQVLVAADPRYGPTYYAGLAQQVWATLAAHGYRRGCGVPVTLLGYSGGAQMSLGVSWFLTLLGVRCSVISIGGVYSDDPGFEHVEHFWDLRGGKDVIRLAGPLAFPGRWGINVASTWNRARHAGRVTVVDAGPVTHDGPGSYFDLTAEFEDGRTHAEALVTTVVGLLEDGSRVAGRA